MIHYQNVNLKFVTTVHNFQIVRHVTMKDAEKEEHFLHATILIFNKCKVVTVL
jgi:hypothetical protein